MTPQRSDLKRGRRVGQHRRPRCRATRHGRGEKRPRLGGLFARARVSLPLVDPERLRHHLTEEREATLGLGMRAAHADDLEPRSCLPGSRNAQFAPLSATSPALASASAMTPAAAQGLKSCGCVVSLAASTNCCGVGDGWIVFAAVLRSVCSNSTLRGARALNRPRTRVRLLLPDRQTHRR
jgi:hypothetical protein